MPETGHPDPGRKRGAVQAKSRDFRDGVSTVTSWFIYNLGGDVYGIVEEFTQCWSLECSESI